MNRCTTNETISGTAESKSGISNGNRQDSKPSGRKQCFHRVLAPNKIGNSLAKIDLWYFVHNPRVLQLLAIGKIAKAFQPEGQKELFGGDEGIGRPSSRRPWPCPDQVACMEPPDQIATDLLAEDVLESVAGDRLMVGDGGQDRDVEFA